MFIDKYHWNVNLASKAIFQTQDHQTLRIWCILVGGIRSACYEQRDFKPPYWCSFPRRGHSSRIFRLMVWPLRLFSLRQICSTLQKKSSRCNSCWLLSWLNYLDPCIHLRGNRSRYGLVNESVVEWAGNCFHGPHLQSSLGWRQWAYLWCPTCGITKWYRIERYWKKQNAIVFYIQT